MKEHRSRAALSRAAAKRRAWTRRHREEARIMEAKGWKWCYALGAWVPDRSSGK
jgi:hypothetical protein